MFGLTNLLRPSLLKANPTKVLNFQLTRLKHEYAPRFKQIRKAFKGRVTVRTGGSVKGNSLQFGELGLRLKSKGIRFNANQLFAADKVLKRELRPSGADLITRFVCNTPVCVKGNQTRMGKGKGPFDHWACRVPTGKVLFEIRGEIHDKVAREALRKAADKLPGLFEIITPKSKVRVSITHLIEKPKPVNYVELMNAKPTSKWTNVQAAKEDVYMMFRGR